MVGGTPLAGAQKVAGASARSTRPSRGPETILLLARGPARAFMVVEPVVALAFVHQGTSGPQILRKSEELGKGYYKDRCVV